jgi:hypothetical protein
MDPRLPIECPRSRHRQEYIVSLAWNCIHFSLKTKHFLYSSRQQQFRAPKRQFRHHDHQDSTLDRQNIGRVRLKFNFKYQ